MKTTGQILRKARLAKKISLGQVETATKIRQEFLDALEEDDWQKLSSLTSARGFVKNYAEFLGLSSQMVLAVFRRDFGKNPRPKIILPGAVKPLNKIRFSWSPKLTLAVSVAIVFLSMVVYLGYQYFSLVRKPDLEIIFPLEGARTSNAQVEIFGRASINALVTVNNQTIFLSPEGEFRYQWDLFLEKTNL